MAPYIKRPRLDEERIGRGMPNELAKCWKGNNLCLVDSSYLVMSGVTILILCADDLSGFLSKLNLLPTVVYKRTSVFWRGLGTIVHLGYIDWLIDWFLFPKCLLFFLYIFFLGGGGLPHVLWSLVLCVFVFLLLMVTFFS